MAHTQESLTQGILDFRQSGFNFNVLGAKTDTFDLGALSSISIRTVLASGAFGIGVLRPECSVDAVTFFPITGVDISLAGLNLTPIIIGVRFFRLGVLTAAGVSSTLDFQINVKV